MKDKITKMFQKYNLSIDENQADKMVEFYKFLISENQKYNLTTITDETEFITKHLLDSVICYKIFETNSQVIDIGAGAGFPSIPLAILRNDIKFILIDSVNKKVEFQKQVTSFLNIRNIESYHSRIEDFAKKNRNRFDYVVARAVAPLSVVLEYSLPLLKIGGKLIAYKGKNFEDELEQSRNAFKILCAELMGAENHNIEGNERSIVSILKINKTSEKFPRAQNKPRLKPL